MLREVYVMENGMDLFHYSSVERTDDDFVLTSGFFSALESFSSDVRQANIDFFSSSEEIFLFSKFSEKNISSDITIVIVCDNDMQQAVARELLKRVKEIIKDSVLFTLPPSQLMTDSEARELRKNIENAANSLISVEYQVKVAEELISEDGLGNEIIDQLLIYNYYKNEVFYNYHAIDINQKKQLTALNKLQRVIIPLVKKCHIGENFEYITIESLNSILVIFKNGTDLTLISSIMKNSSMMVKDLPFKMMSMPGFEVFSMPYSQFKSSSIHAIDKSGNISFEGGNAIFRLESPITKTLQIIDSIVNEFKFEDWQEVFIYPIQPLEGYIKIHRNFTRAEKYFEIFN